MADKIEQQVKGIMDRAANPPKSYPDSSHYWNMKKGAYPFHATAPIGVPKPHHVPETMVGDFICCPFNELAHWGFKTEKGRAVFLKTFPMAQVLE